MNKHTKIILISILVILLIVCIFVIINESFQSENNTANDLENEYSEEDNNIVHIPVIDKIQTDALIYSIEEEKVYYLYENEKKEVTSIKGIPIQVVEYIEGGVYSTEVLTKDGTIWYNETSDIGIFQKKQELEKYKIKEIIVGKSGDLIGYTTQDNKTIDQNGNEYLINKYNFLASYGEKNALKIKDDKTVYYDKDGKYNYVAVKDKAGNDIKAKTVYWQYSSMLNDLVGKERYIIITENNKLYYVELNQNAVELGNGKKIKSTEFNKGVDEYDVEYIEAIFIMEDDSKVKITDINSKLFDVQNMQTKNIKIK